MCSTRSTERAHPRFARVGLVLQLTAWLASLLLASSAAADPLPAEDDQGKAAIEKAADEVSGQSPAAAGKAPKAAGSSEPKSEEERELEEMLGIVEDFQQQTSSYKKEIQLIVERKYDEKRTAVVASYEKAIDELEEVERERRQEAIKVFEGFLAKYPSDPRYTPGALWRLAELYYERSKLALAEQEERFEKELAAFNRGQREQEPVPPVAHFEKTIAMLQRLIGDFPTYKLLDGAHYLLAYCLQEQGEATEAEGVWTSFAERFPSSKLLPEVYTRLGELYFEDPDKLKEAIQAYSKVLEYPDSPMFDKALYKLAWTYYKVDRFQEAVENFDRLIAWSDKGQAGEDGEQDVARTELRKEALQYLAISFAEDEWAGSGTENALAFFRSRPDRAYKAEFFRKLGEFYFIDAKYDKSVVATRQAIELDPLHETNPKLMSTIIDSHARLGKLEAVASAQEELVRRFGKGSEWWEANKDNQEATSEASKLAENALHSAAVFHHTMAQRLKQQERSEDARREYSAAAAAYQKYLDNFPRSRDSYRLTFYLAESYYYSLQFDKAAETYALVRDSAAGDEFLTESANSVVLARLNLVKAAEERGELEPLKIYTSKDRPADLKVEPRPVPELRQKLIAAQDAYAAKLPKDEEADNMAFQAAQVFYAFDHLDEARERFAKIVAETGKADLASSSTNLIIESYLVTQDWVQVEKWSRKLAALTRDPKLRADLKEFELGARFNNASNLMASGEELRKTGKQEEANKKLDAAAAEFVRLVDDDPKGETSDKALNNAAYCYSLSNRPVSAGKIYERIVREFPRSEFADKSLFLMAGSAEASYQFQRAIDNYIRLVDEYKKSEFRGDALYNAAVALEGDQQYGQAAQAYERYAKLFPDRKDASANYFHAGRVLEKKKDWRGVMALYLRFMKAYRRDPAEQERLVMAQMKIAEAYEALGDSRRSASGYQETIKLYDRYRLAAGGQAAEAAAKARFLLVERKLKAYEKITFDVSPRKLKQTLNAKAVSLKKMEDQYKQIFGYKRVQWTLAAYYRLGYLYENFADVLINAPCPKGLNEEECDIYKGKLYEFAETPIKKAVGAYVETMEKSKSFKVANDWTQKALESLNRFEPLTYPLQKEPASALVVDRHAAQPLIQIVESGVKPSGK
ncbi:MAG: tetratricopeptide repeat protein [Deltaproteobacteria bacterium]|nr:tetratricopeptide repeat protein [Deltaproteobacteria bacterium]